MLPSGLPEVEPVPMPPIRSLADLRSLHSTLIHRNESDDLTIKPTLGEILGFLDAAVALGELLQEPRLRESAQGTIDYWAGVLLSQAPQVAESPRSFRLKEFSREVSPIAAKTALVAQERSKEVAAEANEITSKATGSELSCLRAILSRIIRLKASSLNVYTVPIPVQDDMFSSKVARTVLARLESGNVIREVKLDGEPAYTLADESLVNEWEFLGKIVAARKALREMARAWDRSERSGTGLLSPGQHLEDASTYRDLNTIEEEFVKASRNKKDLLQKRIIWVACIAAGIAVCLLVLYVMQLFSLLAAVRAESAEKTEALQLAKEKTQEALKNANEANDARENEHALNARLQDALAQLQQQQARVPDKIAASAACARYVQKGDELQGNQRLEDAEKAYTQARDCQKKLVDEYSDDNELLFQLSITYNSLGKLRLALNNSRGALTSFEDALKIREKLASAPNAEARWKLGKFYSLLYTSDAAARAGDDSKALRLAREASSFINQLSAGKDPTAWHTELSLAEEQLKRLESNTKN